jgi:methyltransferase (TIGR00027 family)
VIADGAPSMTARRVAAHRLDFGRAEAPYGDPAGDDALTAEAAGGIQVPDGRMHRYLAARTMFFDTVVVRAIEGGVRQIVIGGAGYDGRALRYAAPRVRWFEVDHPATQQDKLAILGRLGLDVSQVRFVAADFAADPVAGPLTAAGLDPAEPALFLLEGVAVYLAADTLEDLLGQFRSVAAKGSRLAVSLPVAGARHAGPRFRDSVASMGEPALSRFDPDEAEAMLARTGWHRRGLPAGAVGERLRSAGLLTAQAGPRLTRRAAARRVIPDEEDARDRSLIALLSRALVAFTIEADNEAEHLMPHRTSDYGSGPRGSGPWLTSLAMYENCLRYLGDGAPRTIGELAMQARTGTNIDGMRRWGYITVSGPPRPDGTSRPVRSAAGRLRKHGPGDVLQVTEAGRRASEVWAPLPGLVETRWLERFGDAQVRALRDALQTLAGHFDPALPDCLPILGYALFARPADPPPPPSAQPVADLPLNALLSRALRAAQLGFERESTLSMAMTANVVRVLSAGATRVRDLPRLTGVSKESISMALNALSRAGLAVTGKAAGGGRWQTVSLTPEGVAARQAHLALLAARDERLAGLDRAAAGVIGDVLRPLPLMAGIAPYPDGWRARVPPPATLPRFPMVLHRGGYPDGS